MLRVELYFGDQGIKGGTSVMILKDKWAPMWFDTYYGRHKTSFQQRMKAVITALEYAECHVSLSDDLTHVLTGR